MSTTHLSRPTVRRQRQIGPLGTAARAFLGLVLVGLVVEGHVTGDFDPWAWVLGFVGFPAAVVGWQAWRARRPESRLRVSGATAPVILVVVFVVLYSIDATSDAAMVFIGTSMLVAAARGYAGCEVLAVSNWLLRRDDQVGCIVFSPIDTAERQRNRAGQR